MEILKEVQGRMSVCQTSPEEFEYRIICMSMFNDIGRTKKRSFKECFSNSEKVKGFAKRVPLGHWSFLGPGEENVYGTHNYKPEGQWNTTADVMVDNFKDSGHPMFRAASALDLEFLR